MSPISDRIIAPRFPRLGRISCGWQDVKIKQDGNRTFFPRREKTLVFHSSDERRLRVVADVLGGEVRPAPADPEERWFLVSETAELVCTVPTSEIDLYFGQWFEAWASSGLVRRCDGETCILWRQPAKGNDRVGELSREARDCVCREQGLEGDAACNPIVRVSVLPVGNRDTTDDAALWHRIPGLGVWAVTSSGWSSNTELKSDVELIRSLLGEITPGVRFLLRVEQIRSRHGDVPMLRLELASSPQEAVAIALEAGRPLINLPALAGGPEEDEPVGTFVTTAELPEPVEAEVVEDAIPGDPGGPDTDPAPGVPSHTVDGFTFEPLPDASPAASADERATRGVWTVAVAKARSVGVGEDATAEIFRLRHGFPWEDASRVDVVRFGDWLKATKRSAS